MWVGAGQEGEDGNWLLGRGGPKLKLEGGGEGSEGSGLVPGKKGSGGSREKKEDGGGLERLPLGEGRGTPMLAKTKGGVCNEGKGPNAEYR